MKTLLVPVARHTLLDSVLDTAVLPARRFGASIEGFGLRPALAEYVPVDMVGGHDLGARRGDRPRRGPRLRRAVHRRDGAPRRRPRERRHRQERRALALAAGCAPRRRLPRPARAAVLRHRRRPARQRRGRAAHDDPRGGAVRERAPPRHRPAEPAREHRRDRGDRLERLDRDRPPVAFAAPFLRAASRIEVLGVDAGNGAGARAPRNWPPSLNREACRRRGAPWRPAAGPPARSSSPRPRRSAANLLVKGAYTRAACAR